MKDHLALLRGINVGGNNIIKMAELKSCFERLGFTEVATFIQSGNVLFKTSEKNLPQLAEKIEAALSKRFSYRSCVVIVPRESLKKAVRLAPKNFGKNPEMFRCDVIFLKEPLTARLAIKSVTTKEGVDQATAGREVLYFSRLADKASQSRLSKIVQLPIYKNMTIRNWNTTTKLLAMMEARE